LSDGSSSLRFAARRLSASLSKLPPRFTRFEPLLADPLDLAQPLERARRRPRDVQALPVGKDDVGRGPLVAGGPAPPVEQRIVARPLDLVELPEQPAERRALGNLALLVVAARGRLAGLRLCVMVPQPGSPVRLRPGPPFRLRPSGAEQAPGFQVDGPKRGPLEVRRNEAQNFWSRSRMRCVQP
jgi:hypothetical protein